MNREDIRGILTGLYGLCLAIEGCHGREVWGAHSINKRIGDSFKKAVTWFSDEGFQHVSVVQLARHNGAVSLQFERELLRVYVRFHNMELWIDGDIPAVVATKGINEVVEQLYLFLGGENE